MALAAMHGGSPQPARHGLAGLADEAARTPLMPGADFDDPEDEGPLYAARQKVYPQSVKGT
jgi:hypothetical protein